MTAPDAGTAAQNRASDPAQSTWLGANAGSGKTTVLIDRVVRLLLGGTRPERVLCLTYTKAAAGEMQNRLFRRLGAWSMLPDDRLREELRRFGDGMALSGDRLAGARRLFAQAVEAPGGLKIQTIHAFCASILRRFPVEAGVAPGFAELDEDQSKELRERVAEEIASGGDVGLVDAVVARLSDDQFQSLLGEISRNRNAFGDAPGFDDCLAMVGLEPGFDGERLRGEVLSGGEEALIQALVPILLTGKPTDTKVSEALSGSLLATSVSVRLKALEDVLLTGEKAAVPYAAKIGSLPTKDVRNGPAAAFMPALEALMRRVEAARPRRIAREMAERTHALYSFAARFVPLYEARKAARGWIDFDDLIGRASALLNDASVASWVLWRLDGGIDHILVDEAQDTSPAQWALIERLTEEITAGEGAGGAGRTLFVVGDPKQSIYSFQGADLAAFTRMRATFRAALGHAGRPLVELGLTTSYRSAEPVLRLVDEISRQISGLGPDEVRHIAADTVRPGRVDLWPPVPKPEDVAEEDAILPIAPLRPPTAGATLAGQIADEIRALLRAGTRIVVREGGGTATRAMHEGDVLILVRRRNALFGEVIRACKSRGLAIAGADRMRLTDELAVRDILALLRFLALPEDDLSLAVALRSPLFGLSEQALFDLSHRRTRDSYLWQAVRAKADEHPAAAAMIDDLRNVADFMRPYDLIERILIRHGGRARMIGRMGPECEDAIDGLLTQALLYERSEIPSVTGFLLRIEASETEVKRQQSSAARAIRVMTVHGAKGLEAPLVILPDTGDWQNIVKDNLLRDVRGRMIWKDKADRMPHAVAEVVAAAQARQAEERARLLYVALTRAQSWLIVCAAGEAGPDSWHGIVDWAMTAMGDVAAERRAGGAIRRVAHGDWPKDSDAAEAEEAEAVPTVPDWALRRPVAAVQADLAIRPSRMVAHTAGAMGGEGRSGEAARVFGTRLHMLLEHFPLWPEADWPAVARDLLRSDERDVVTEEEVAALVQSCAQILTAPGLAAIMTADALLEVEIAGCPAAFGGRAVEGRIDRLIVEAGRVLAVDYKSDARVPARAGEVPEAYLVQMAAYGAVLAERFPDRHVELAILWTADGSLMPLPADIVSAALQRALSLDVAGQAS